MSSRGRPTIWILIALLGTFVAGCTAMVQSTSWHGTHSGLGCGSRLGTYKLSKTHLRIRITQNRYTSASSNVRPTKPYVLETIEKIARADERYQFCLDYLASPFADDDIHVEKSGIVTKTDAQSVETGTSGSNQLLKFVASNSVDKSAVVLRKLIRTIFIGLSQNAEFVDTRGRNTPGPDTKKVVVTNLEFDPFSPYEVADVNHRIRRLGFCLVLEDYAFNRELAQTSRYCNAPRKVSARYPSIKADIVRFERRVTDKADIKGIHYRPKAPYRLGIYVRSDPGDPYSRWRLAKLEVIKLENISPVLALGVDRAIFAQRRTALVFDDGVLAQVCISKGSEALGFIEVPLDIVYGLVALPSQIIQVRIASANLNASVSTAEDKVIKAQRALIAAKRAPPSEVPDDLLPNTPLSGKEPFPNRKTNRDKVRDAFITEVKSAKKSVLVPAFTSRDDALQEICGNAVGTIKTFVSDPSGGAL
ncbi:MAG: hypothetical protein AAGD43_03880 [Pseudomonadota bacterium]